VRLIGHLNELARVAELAPPVADVSPPPPRDADPLGSVIGQGAAKRALTIAAAGGHHMLMTGPPGAGKTMLAERLRDLLPPLPAAARSSVAEIYSLSGLPGPPAGYPPFRAPHHSASAAALTGGGSPPQPGEITHAHHGVLFMDEMPEFRRDALEALREPLEGGQIRISRRGFTVSYPARFQLVAAMNPCPMGLVCKPNSCRCAPDQALRYKNRISAPILDRIDLHVSVAAVPLRKLLHNTQATVNQSNGRRVELVNRARALQQARSGCLNAHLPQTSTKTVCACSAGVRSLLEQAADKLALSARGYFRALRVARTIADIDYLAGLESRGKDEERGAAPNISEAAIVEALGYRALDS